MVTIHAKFVHCSELTKQIQAEMIGLVEQHRLNFLVEGTRFQLKSVSPLNEVVDAPPPRAVQRQNKGSGSSYPLVTWSFSELKKAIEHDRARCFAMRAFIVKKYLDCIVSEQGERGKERIDLGKTTKGGAKVGPPAA